MPTELPRYAPDAFAHEMERRAPVELSAEAQDRLFRIYRELARWAPRLALIGPGTSAEVLDRHFGESLAAVPLLPEPREDEPTVLDLGSGGGFPGLVLAAVRPDLTVVLTEPRERKWAYLKTAARKAALPCRCLNARVDLPLAPEIPAAFDAVTVRALQVPEEVLEALAERLRPGGRFLLWTGDDAPRPPAGWGVHREVSLPGSDRRRIVEWRRLGALRTTDGNAYESAADDPGSRKPA